MLGSSRTDLHIFDAGSDNGTRYCNEILLPYVSLFRGAIGLQFLFIDDSAPCHRTVAAEQLLETWADAVKPALQLGEIISPTKDRMFLAGHPSQG
ncbi:hypothetical protein TNCV_4288181 [Trichonephila clavipes]|nr:hypothetical protein TNCV_4288181 [Trichonephila clavipes]